MVLPVSFCSEYCRYSLHVAVASRSRFAAAVTASPLSMLLVSRGWRQFLNAEDATRHVAVERRKQPATQERSNPTIALFKVHHEGCPGRRDLFVHDAVRGKDHRGKRQIRRRVLRPTQPTSKAPAAETKAKREEYYTQQRDKVPLYNSGRQVSCF